MHLIVDGTFSRLPSSYRLLEFLREMPGVIGMIPITTPMIQISPVGFIGIVLIAESHISVHTVELRGWVDIFSCKPFDDTLALKEIEERLGLTSMKFRVFERELPT